MDTTCDYTLRSFGLGLCTGLQYEFMKERGSALTYLGARARVGL